MCSLILVSIISIKKTLMVFLCIIFRLRFQLSSWSDEVYWKCLQIAWDTRTSSCRYRMERVRKRECAECSSSTYRRIIADEGVRFIDFYTIVYFLLIASDKMTTGLFDILVYSSQLLRAPMRKKLHLPSEIEKLLIHHRKYVF